MIRSLYRMIPLFPSRALWRRLVPCLFALWIAAGPTLASELVERVAEYKPAVVVIATMPPGGFSHARYLITRLRQRFPEVKVVVGRWGCDESADEVRAEALKNTDGIDRTLSDTRKRLNELHPLLVAPGGSAAGGPANKKELVGTAGA